MSGGLTITKNVNAQYWIPSENEWYKAAYYDPSLNGGIGGYYQYATRSNTAPGASWANRTFANQANTWTGASFTGSLNCLTPVGSFTNSASAYGTFDQGGDVQQWNDATYSISSRGCRGGAWNCYTNSLPSSIAGYGGATAEFSTIGFRVATVPPPVITSIATFSGTVGIAFDGYTITASNSPNSYGASGLPSGLFIGRETGIISGTPTQSGSFNVILSASNGTGIGSASLALTILSPTLSDFRAANGLASDGSQDSLIPASDGVSNLLKYAFNMIGNAPGQAATLLIPNHQTVEVSGSAGLPTSRINGSGNLIITYIRRTASSAPGIAYVVQFSNNLSQGSWAANTSVTESSIAIDSNFECVTVTDSFTGTTKRFARVIVTEL